jgi:alkanesulfonate monooxygenase SsuD/methylene tetrahydromethanopterin reductase-like flavin-dependent oxidoreductase (luciferase family)
MHPRSEPFASGSISLGLYRHQGSATAATQSLLTDARMAEELGFDGITVGEHHNGVDGYFPNPVQMVAFALSETDRIWGAPSPILLPLRNARLLAGEIAWLASRFPDRLGAGFASGYMRSDFAYVGAKYENRHASFKSSLSRISALLGATDAGSSQSETRISDPALIALRASAGLPLVSAASSRAAAARAASVGMGIYVGIETLRDSPREIIDAYTQAGGLGPKVLLLRAATSASIALVPAESDRARETSTIVGSPSDIARELASVVQETGATALNIRFGLRGWPAANVRADTHNIAAHTLPDIREYLEANS